MARIQITGTGNVAIGIIADPASINTVIATAIYGTGVAFVNADNYNAPNQVIRVIYY